MSKINFNQSSRHVATIAAIALTFGAVSIASAFGPVCCFCQQGRCQVEVDQKEVDVSGFDVECKTICIPPLRFPWECGPLKKCGKVRTVKILTTDKTQKTICTYDWSAITCCPDCRAKACRSGSCGHRGKCGAGCGESCCASNDVSNHEASPMMPPATFTVSNGETIELENADQVALTSAIRMAKPDSKGWVTIINPNRQSLKADNALIETTVEVIGQ